MRRSFDAPPVPQIVEGHGVVIDLDAGRVTLLGQPVRFTKAEWKILALLVNEPGLGYRWLPEPGFPGDAADLRR